MKVAILGAGISGLATAYYLRKKYPLAQLEIYEKSGRAGGKVQTVQEGGFVCELGPRGIRPKGKGRHFLQLAEELGLLDELVMADDQVRFRYLYMNGRLEKLPAGPLGMFGCKLLKGVPRAAWREYRNKVPAAEKEEETVSEFISRRFGSRVANDLADPFFTGIYAGDIRKLSAKAVTPALLEYETTYRSVIKGILTAPPVKPEITKSYEDREKVPLVTLRGGLSSLISRLLEILNESVRLNREAPPVSELEQQYDRVISTLPAYELRKLVQPPLREALNTVEYVPVTVVVLNYDKKINPYKGFGYLVPSNQQQAILGCMFSDQIFPDLSPGQGSSFTVMMGGARDTGFHSRSRDEFLRTAKETLARHLNTPAIHQSSSEIVQIWEKAIPQFNIGYIEMKDKIRTLTGNSKLIVSGNFMGGVSVIDCIRQAKRVVGNV